jgi:hypothetical protein
MEFEFRIQVPGQQHAPRSPNSGAMAPCTRAAYKSKSAPAPVEDAAAPIDLLSGSVMSSTAN